MCEDLLAIITNRQRVRDGGGIMIGCSFFHSYHVFTKYNNCFIRSCRSHLATKLY